MRWARPWPGWVVLLGVSFVPAACGNGLAAEPSKAEPAAAPQPAKVEPAAPARKRPSLLGALGDALGGGEERIVRKAAQPAKVPAAIPVMPRAVPAAAPARLEPAKKRPSLLGALADALGGEARAMRKAEAMRVDEAQIRNLESQMLPYFRQLLYVELAHLRRVCKVDGQVFGEIVKATKPDFTATVHKFAVSKLTRRMGGNAGATDAMDPYSQAQRVLTPLVEAKLGRQQAQLYREESEKRAQVRKRAVVLNLVAAMDERLILTAEQREKMVQSLSANYQHGWEQLLQMFSYNLQYLPAIHEDLVVPLLDERQKEVWPQVPKMSVESVWGFHFARAGVAAEAAEIREIERIFREGDDGK